MKIYGIFRYELYEELGGFYDLYKIIRVPSIDHILGNIPNGDKLRKISTRQFPNNYIIAEYVDDDDNWIHYQIVDFTLIDEAAHEQDD